MAKQVYYRQKMTIAILSGVLCMFSGLLGAHEQDGRIVITAEEIAKMQAVRMADVLNQVPGLKAGETYVAIHGSYKVKVLVDGRPVNDPTSSMGGVKWDLVSLENIEKIEILRGKGGLEYGDDASGGVILITTKKIHQFSGNVKAYGGNYQTQSYSTNCRVTRGKVGGALSAAYDATHGYKVNNDKDRWRLGGKIEHSPTDKTGFALTADHIEEDKGYSGTKDYPTPYSRGTSRMSSYSFLAQVESVKTKTYFNDGWNNNSDPSKELDSALQVKEAGEDVSTTIPTGKWGRLSFGAACKWGEASGTTITKKQEDSISVFAAESVNLTNLPLDITTGLRSNFYSDFDNSFNPEIKASWEKKDWNITLSYSRTANIPSFHQRYSETSSMRPNPELDMDQVALPEDKAWNLYKPFVVRRLKRRGLPVVEALKQVENRSELARNEMVAEMGHRPVIINRAPVLHRFGIMAFWPQLTKHNTMEISPLVVKGFNADFDGDQMNFQVPVKDEARQEAIERLMPSANLLNPGDFKSPVHAPSQEYVGGLYAASAFKANKKPRTFRNIRDLKAAVMRGEVGFTDPVEVLE